MEHELTYECMLEALDLILGLSPDNLRTVGSLLSKLDQNLERLLGAARIDETRRAPLFKIVASVRASSAELARSTGNAKRGGQMRGDWMRLAQRDFAALKEDLLALREHIVVEADFIKFICLREQIGELGGTKPAKLFEELHQAGAISERTWMLLMSQPGSWRDSLKEKEVARQLSQISSWLLDLQEARRKREISKKEKSSGDAREHFREKS